MWNMKLGFVSDTSASNLEPESFGSFQNRTVILESLAWIFRKFPESDRHAGIFGLNLPEVSRIGPSCWNLWPESSGSFQNRTIALHAAGILFLPHRNVSGWSFQRHVLSISNPFQIWISFDACDGCREVRVPAGVRVLARRSPARHIQPCWLLGPIITSNMVPEQCYRLRFLLSPFPINT